MTYDDIYPHEFAQTTCLFLVERQIESHFNIKVVMIFKWNHLIINNDDFFQEYVN